MYEMYNVDFVELFYVEAKNYSNVNFNVFSKNLYSKIINLLNCNFLAFFAAVSVIGLVCVGFTSLTLQTPLEFTYKYLKYNSSQGSLL